MPEPALASDRLGVPSVVFFVISAATPLTVVAGVVTTGYATTGLTGLPLAYLVVGAVLALFSVGYVAMARDVANAGAFYAYIARGLGRPLGVGSAWVALAAYNALQVGLYGAIGAAAKPLLSDWFGLDVAWWVIALVSWAAVAVLGLQDIGLNGRVVAVLLAAEIAVILIYSIADVAHPAGGAVSLTTLAAGNLFGPGLGALLALAVLGFVGFESCVVYSEEARDRHRTVRVATYTAVALIALLYTFASWAMSVATGPARIVGRSRAEGADLVFHLAAGHLGTGFVHAGRALFVTSVLAAMIAFHHTTARYVFALGRERILPASAGSTSPRTGSPRVGSLAQTVLGLAVILVYAAGGWDPLVHLFYWGGTIGGLGILLLLAATALAVVAHFAREPGEHGLGRRVLAPVPAALLLLGVLALALANFDTLLGVSPSSPLRWGAPLTYAVLLAAGTGWGLLLRRRRPRVYEAVGRGGVPHPGTAPPQAPPGQSAARDEEAPR
ncbi:APC family permease [Streptomyces sp. ODS28]|uniref:APC family permease n=1 Tax=Streptomyces sp. ODS28 TaxID=3136688 RepID=UPI0031E59CBE